MSSFFHFRRLSFGLVLLITTVPAVAASNQPRAVFPSTSYVFGTVKQGEKIVRAFVLRNEGTAPLKIQRASLSMRDMTIKFARMIPEGENTKVVIEWDTSHLAGQIEGEATLYLNDPDQPEMTLYLKGNVTPPIDIRPFPAIFLSVFQGETAEQSLTIVNNQKHPVAVKALHPVGRHFEAAVEVVEPGKTYSLRVTVPPNVPVGRYAERLAIETDDPGHSRIHVLVNVMIKPDVFVNPASVDFRHLSLRQLRANPERLPLMTNTFLLKRREGEMTITSVETNVPFLDIRQDPPERSQTFRFNVDLDLERIVLGKIDGAIRIETDDPDFPELVVPVRGEIKE